MWRELLAAFALMLIIEGILPFLNPAALRRALSRAMRMNDQMLRFIGLSSMLAGVILLYLIK